MHRDTKLHELIGMACGILTAELCVLDDISRAPGEALNILLRLLNERLLLKVLQQLVQKHGVNQKNSLLTEPRAASRSMVEPTL
eukprot:Skav206751  [mRNA]  locus=scaffold167:9351:12995:- [translate_table: standard]